MKNNKKGFTLIELLVVIAIIGLLATLSVVALNNARMKSRDAKRVSDIKQVQTALELYFVDQNGYPSVASALTLGETGAKALSQTNSFADTAAGTTYMGQVPAAPTPPTGNAYAYCSATSAAPTTCAASTQSYMITFTLEGATGGLASGARTATPNGIQ
jgi:type II secretion system protein G